MLTGNAWCSRRACSGRRSRAGRGAGVIHGQGPAPGVRCPRASGLHQGGSGVCVTWHRLQVRSGCTVPRKPAEDTRPPDREHCRSHVGWLLDQVAVIVGVQFHGVSAQSRRPPGRFGLHRGCAFRSRTGRGERGTTPGRPRSSLPANGRRLCTPVWPPMPASCCSTSQQSCGVQTREVLAVTYSRQRSADRALHCRSEAMHGPDCKAADIESGAQSSPGLAAMAYLPRCRCVRRSGHECGEFLATNGGAGSGAIDPAPGQRLLE